MLGSALQQLGELGPERGRQLLARQTVGDIRQQEADLRPAVVDRAVEAYGVERLAARQFDHRVGDLDLVAGAALAALEDGEDLRLQDVAAGDVQVGGRRSWLWLLDHAGDTRYLRVPVFDANDAVEVGLVLGHRRDGDV